MTIEFNRTENWKEKTWENYTKNYNKAFSKSLTIKHFRDKYLNHKYNSCYHTLLIVDKDIVGCCTAIPIEYTFKDTPILIGQMVDVFILEKYRNNPFTLLKMYNKLRSNLIQNGVKGILAVPNDNVYQYWKSIAKWKDIGQLDYWVCIKDLKKILKSKSDFCLNTCYKKILNINVKFNSALELIIKRSNKDLDFKLLPDSEFFKRRFKNEYVIVKEKEFTLIYKVYNEKGLRYCYLMDFTENKNKTSAALIFTIRKILKEEEIDVILFVGKISFFQTLLLKVPKRLVKKQLRLMGDFYINSEDMSNFKGLYDIKNWDYGLLNFDVR